MSRCKDWGQPHDHAHGTTAGWPYHGCRCDECRKAHYAYHRAFDALRSSNESRRSWKRRYTRAQRAVGNPTYQNHGDGSSHRMSGWSAQARYREQNRALLNHLEQKRNSRIRANVGAVRRPWTATDDKLVQREDISITEMAYLISRTPSSIRQRRYRLRNRELAR